MLWKVGESAWDNNKITDTLKALPTYGPLLPAAVTSANPQQATADAGGRVDRRIEYGRRSLGASLPFGYSARTDAA
ncbi:Penicillin-binding protein 1A [Escherichia coli]|uniref:Penicillin-binding protein 1A n=1 Tax=Escherichia coli TaxID=562 RepID=A0A376TXK5_ECOLX|nr:Penicillin-binding protein 1A [Escherichia coli]